MPFKVYLSSNAPIVHLEHHGDCTLEEHHQGRIAAISELEHSGAKKLLVDARNLPKPSNDDSVNFSLENGAIIPNDVFVAVILHDSEMPTGKISETIARSQKVNIRFFSSAEVAEDWLMSGLK